MNRFFIDTYVQTKRHLLVILRNPFIFLPNIMISLFFLLVYQGGLSSIANLDGFAGDYLAFILPVSIVSAAIGGSGGAGQSLVRDLENGYFSRLLLTPATRISIVLGPMIAGMIQLLVQTILILIVALFMGLDAKAGIGGLFVVILLAAGFGLAFAGYSVGVSLRAKNAQASQAGTFIFFPLIFLSSTFVPLEFIEAEWLKFIAQINPTTYIFEGMRAVLNEGWEWTPILQALLAIGIMCAITITFASFSAKRALNRD
jgi:ABC-2 type transport system permease protein